MGQGYRVILFCWAFLIALAPHVLPGAPSILILGSQTPALQLASRAAAGETLSRARRDGFARIGLANEAPFAYLTETGKVAGEAPEIARHVLARLEVPRLVAVVVNFGDLIDHLEQGKIDVIAAGMFVTPERCARVLFSNPTYGIGQALLVKAGNPLSLRDYADIAAHDRAVLAVMAGAAEQDYAAAAAIPPARIQAVPTPFAGMRAVQSGAAEAFALTAHSIQNLLTSAGPAAGVAMTEPFDGVAGKSVTGHGAFAFRRGDEAFRDAFDRVLDDFIGSPEHLALVAPHGFGKAYLPKATTETLCEGP